MLENYSVVDLFCGVGGLTHGLVLEGFNVVAGIDIDQTCRYAFETNNKVPFVNKGVEELSGNYLKNLYPKGQKKILIGCAPCQPFSLYAKTTPEQKKDSKWKLLYSFGELIRKVNPSIVSMENVPQLKTFKDGKVFKDFVRTLESTGYHVTHYTVNAQDYGVPQRRKRLLLFASKFKPIEIIAPTHKAKYVTVRDAIGFLPEIEDGQIDANDMLHRSRKMEDITKRRIQATPEGGSWRDWPQELISECHTKENGKDFGSVYGRMKWDDVSPTLTTFCTGFSNGRFGHPTQDRAISLREAALLQTFPKNYKFVDTKVDFCHADIETHIGNAVPVLLGRVVAKSIKRSIEDA